MMQNISILGSTGSIGRQTCAVAEHLGIKVCALAARRDIKLLEAQARKFSPRLVAVFEEKAAAELALALADTDIEVISGEAGLIAAATMQECDCVVTAVALLHGVRLRCHRGQRQHRSAPHPCGHR